MRVSSTFRVLCLWPSDRQREGQIRVGMVGLRHKERHRPPVFDGVLVWKIDRYGRSLRSLKHVVNALVDLSAHGVAFDAPDLGCDFLSFPA